MRIADSIALNPDSDRGASITGRPPAACTAAGAARSLNVCTSATAAPSSALAASGVVPAGSDPSQSRASPSGRRFAVVQRERINYLDSQPGPGRPCPPM